MSEPLPPRNEEAEQSVLGALLVGSDGRKVFATVSAEEGLRPDDFYRERHRLIYGAAAELADGNEPIDPVTLAERLGERLDDAGGLAYLHHLPDVVPSVGSFRQYARIVRDHAYRRELLAAARELQQAAMSESRDGIAEALGRLAKPEEPRRVVTLESRMEALYRHLNSRVELTPWPFQALNEMTSGGMWPGHLTFLIGHSGHGKSVLADMILATAAKHVGKSACCAYLTEMTPLERDLRFLTSRADLNLKRLMRNRLDSQERGRAAGLIDRLPFELQPVGTWKVDQVGRDIMRRGLKFAVVDLFNAIAGRETKDIDESVARLAGIANDTGCHVVACQHLNRARLTGVAYPLEPTQGDIRGSGAIFDLATNVMSVYRRERDESGEASDEAVVRLLKVKNGSPGRLDAVFNGSRMRFELPAEPGTVARTAA